MGLIIFLVLTTVQAGYLWFQWNRISDFVEIGQLVVENVNVHKKQPLFVRWAGKLIKKFKKMLWIPAGILLFINLIVGGILGGVYDLIMWIVQLF